MIQRSPFNNNTMQLIQYKISCIINIVCRLYPLTSSHRMKYREIYQKSMRSRKCKTKRSSCASKEICSKKRKKKKTNKIKSFCIKTSILNCNKYGNIGKEHPSLTIIIEVFKWYRKNVKQKKKSNMKLV